MCSNTTAYYPLLVPDDLLAFGIMLWEIATKQHPLFPKETDATDVRVGSDLTEWVETYRSTGQYYIGEILRLRRPSEIMPNVSPYLENILLKSLQLKLNSDNTIVKDEGYTNYSEMRDSLMSLQENGLDRL